MNHDFCMKWRIRTTMEFNRIYLGGQRLLGYFYLLYFQNNNLGYPRLGVVASRKNLKKAVIRNRSKRIVKEQFRLQKHRLPSIDIVFIAKSQLKEARKQELHKCVNELFNQLIM